MRTGVLSSAFVLLLSLTARAQEVAVALPDLVAVHAGELPFIISAPHGGSRKPPDVEPRTGEGLEKGPRGFVTGQDTGTYELAREVVAEIERRYRRKPYFVLSRTHRKYLDPNRPPAIAYEDDDAKPVYARYHDTLTQYCRDVQRRFRAGLLLDVHGQGSRADTVFRGTQNGRTVELLRQRHGEGAQAGEASLFGLLRERGWKVHPDPLDGKEQAGFTGGFIVQSYGSHQAVGVDAVQLEFGKEFRTSEHRQQTARILVDAVVAYADKYLGLPASAAPPVEPIDVAVFVGDGTAASKTTVIDVIRQSPQFSVREVSADDIREGKLKNMEVLVHPGGSGSGQGKALGEEGREKVREFIAGGGGYIGICAGAYLATCDYEWSLNILDAKVVDRAHWARGYGPVEIGISQQGQTLLGVREPKTTIYYHQGPLLAPAGNPNIADYEPLATFEGEIAKNGAPMGVMPGTTAIASGTHGKGRVLCFSPHPERSPGLESFLTRAVLWSSQRDNPK